MSKHTPGPWIVCNTADIFTNLGSENAEGISAPSSDGWMIADCDMGSLSLDEVQANARLISAAPDLLEFALLFLERNGMDESWMTSKARAAIAKATGEQQ